MLARGSAKLVLKVTEHGSLRFGVEIFPIPEVSLFVVSGERREL